MQSVAFILHPLWLAANTIKVEPSMLSNNILNRLNVELNPIRHLLALVGARHLVHVSRIRVNGAQEHIGR